MNFLEQMQALVESTKGVPDPHATYKEKPQGPSGGFMGSGHAVQPTLFHSPKAAPPAAGAAPTDKQASSGPPMSAGCVQLAGTSPDDLKMVWIRHSKANPGYPASWTFPKGRGAPGESEKDTAERESFEETGLKTKVIPGTYLGTFRGSVTMSKFWLATVTGTPRPDHKETDKVELVTWGEAIKRFAHSGNNRDPGVAMRAVALIRKKYGVEPLDDETKAEHKLVEKTAATAAASLDAAIERLEGELPHLKAVDVLRPLRKDIEEQIQYLKKLRERVAKGSYVVTA